jgi:hypothetical protein
MAMRVACPAVVVVVRRGAMAMRVACPAVVVIVIVAVVGIVRGVVIRVGWAHHASSRFLAAARRLGRPNSGTAS